MRRLSQLSKLTGRNLKDLAMEIWAQRNHQLYYQSDVHTGAAINNVTEQEIETISENGIYIQVTFTGGQYDSHGNFVVSGPCTKQIDVADLAMPLPVFYLTASKNVLFYEPLETVALFNSKIFEVENKIKEVVENCVCARLPPDHPLFQKKKTDFHERGTAQVFHDAKKHLELSQIVRALNNSDDGVRSAILNQNHLHEIRVNLGLR